MSFSAPVVEPPVPVTLRLNEAKNTDVSGTPWMIFRWQIRCAMVSCDSGGRTLRGLRNFSDDRQRSNTSRRTEATHGHGMPWLRGYALATLL